MVLEGRGERLSKKLMSGNEAIAYGAWLAGVRVGSGYPGTPSTEILESLAGYDGVYVEWAPNEKVAFDVCVGAAYAGVRALVTMKHVGLNVASDSLFYASYTGVSGGLVVVSADDPGMFSSQGEQDNRHYARFAKVPMLEPSDGEEAKRLTVLAFELSERFDTPVLLRSTTRLSHSKSVVVLSQSTAPFHDANVAGRRGERVVPVFVSDPEKYVMIPKYARHRHLVVEERLERLREFAEGFEENRFEPGDTGIGVISAGIAYQYAREVFREASFLKLGMTYPLPRRLIMDFAGRVRRVVVVEELDPFLEEQIRALGVEVEGMSIRPATGELSPTLLRDGASKRGLAVSVGGGDRPSSSDGPRDNHYSPVDVPVADAAGRLLRREGLDEELASTARSNLAGRVVRVEDSREGHGTDDAIPDRPPILCPGCGHRGVFYLLRKLKFKVFGDIGCYTLAVQPPLSAIDTVGCMGASIGVLHGIARAGIRERIAAAIGDSTFFHSGIAPLMNLVYNGGCGLIVILDNGTTAMTGHQPHAGSGLTLRGEPTRKLSIPDVVRALGVEEVHEVDAYALSEIREILIRISRDGLAADKPVVLVVRHPCVLKAKEKNRPARVDAEKCNGCLHCLDLGCPSLKVENGNPVVDQLSCNGCGVCAMVCPREAIVTLSGSHGKR